MQKSAICQFLLNLPVLLYPALVLFLSAQFLGWLCVVVVVFPVCKVITFPSSSCFSSHLCSSGKFLSLHKTPFIFELSSYVERFCDYRNFIPKMCCSPGDLFYLLPVVAATNT